MTMSLRRHDKSIINNTVAVGRESSTGNRQLVRRRGTLFETPSKLRLCWICWRKTLSFLRAMAKLCYKWSLPTLSLSVHVSHSGRRAETVAIMTSSWFPPPRRFCFHSCLSVCLYVCLSICLFVNRITQKLLIKSLWNFTEYLDIIQGQSSRFWR